LQLEVFDTKVELGQAAARDAAKIINQAISERGAAYVIAATGASQFEFLDSLVVEEIDWAKVVFFHLDEYVGLPESHPASFRRYLKERILSRIQPRSFHLINGEAEDVYEECRRVGELIEKRSMPHLLVSEKMDTSHSTTRRQTSTPTNRTSSSISISNVVNNKLVKVGSRVLTKFRRRQSQCQSNRFSAAGTSCALLLIRGSQSQ